MASCHGRLLRRVRVVAGCSPSSPAGLAAGDWLTVVVTVHETAGGLRATVDDDGVVRIAWGDERDWFGPATPPSHPGVRCTVRADDQRPALVFRIEATADLAGMATGTFADPSVAWPHFRPADRMAGGVPDETTAFGYQYSEFAFPTQTDSGMAG